MPMPTRAFSTRCRREWIRSSSLSIFRATVYVNRSELQKGGVPAAPSGTATLLRLSPSHRYYPSAPLAVTPGGPANRQEQADDRGRVRRYLPLRPHPNPPGVRVLHSKLPSQSGFCVISMHFTATQHIPPTSFTLKYHSFKGNFNVKHQDFTPDL